MADTDLEIAAFVRRIRTRFPSDAALADAWLAERAWTPQDSPSMWLEAFADRTTDAMRPKNWALVRDHTGFTSELLR